MKPTILAAWAGPLLVTILLALTALRWRRALRASGLLGLLSLGMGVIALSGTMGHFLVYAIVAVGGTPSQVERAALDWLLTPAWVLGVGAAFATVLETRDDLAMGTALSRMRIGGVALLPVVLLALSRIIVWVDNRYDQEWQEAYEGNSRVQYRSVPRPELASALADVTIAQVILDDPQKGQPFGNFAVRGYAIDRAGSLFAWDPGHPTLHAVRLRTPFPVRTISRWGTRFCSVDEAGLLSCWSWNDPARTATLPGVAAMDVSSGVRSRLCVLMASGRAACWVEPSEEEEDPFAHPSVEDWLSSGDIGAITARFGNIGCIARRGGPVECWWNQGPGATFHGVVPGVHDAARLASSAGRGCAIQRDGRLFCWSVGQRHDLQAKEYLEGKPVEQVSMAPGHTCAITARGSVHCWGGNEWGQLGDGSLRDRDLPVEVDGLAPAVAVAVEATITCVAHLDGRASCWGKRARFQ